MCARTVCVKTHSFLNLIWQMTRWSLCRKLAFSLHSVTYTESRRHIVYYVGHIQQLHYIRMHLSVYVKIPRLAYSSLKYSGCREAWTRDQSCNACLCEVKKPSRMHGFPVMQVVEYRVPEEPLPSPPGRYLNYRKTIKRGCAMWGNGRGKQS